MLYCTSLCSRPIENNLPAIQWLDRSEVVHNILVGPVLQHPELGQLGRGDGDGLEEVDPVDDLHAAGGGQGARVGAEGGVFHISYEGWYLYQNNNCIVYKIYKIYRKC